MCCFSQSVTSVAGTRIFARRGKGTRQFLAYQMTFSSPVDLAMILPLPVPQGTLEGAVHFINLEAFPEFFDRLKDGFPDPPTRGLSKSDGPIAAAANAPLAVEQVGSYEASFVPTLKDFARLDARFRLKEGTWDRLPQYESYGFAVFKLKKEAHTVHPMAFEFPRADGSKLFFPTVHIHDGTVHPDAHFDHQLYCQIAEGESLDAVAAWRESAQLAGQFVNASMAKGLIDPAAHCYLRPLAGVLPNRDTWV
jgi:hypothetical protein